MELSPGDRLPKAVCVTCVTNLDYCIQFVDRWRMTYNAPGPYQ